MVTVWSKRAKGQLQKAFNYIAQDSPRSAAKSETRLLILVLILPKILKYIP